MFLFATVFGSAFIYWALARLKKVALSGSALVISDFKTEISVHLSNVDRVSGSLFVTPELAWINFREPTEFGNKVIFMPKIRWFGGFTRHPIVEELRRLSSSSTHGAA